MLKTSKCRFQLLEDDAAIFYPSDLPEHRVVLSLRQGYYEIYLQKKDNEKGGWTQISPINFLPTEMIFLLDILKDRAAKNGNANTTDF